MKRILVIDDEVWLVEMVKMALNQRGYEVIEANDGPQGVEMARKELPDLILCDVNMKKLDGYGTLSALRNEPSTATIPFILMTGMADNAGMRQGMVSAQMIIFPSHLRSMDSSAQWRRVSKRRKPFRKKLKALSRICART